MKIKRMCLNCEKEFLAQDYYVKRGQYKYCSNKCRTSHSLVGEKCHMWKGGKNKDSDGYILVYCPEHPHAVNKYVREHRLVMEKFIGRYLEKKETVHHINENKLDNRIENLELMTFNNHRSLHTKNCKRDSLGRFSN